jgi:hypothetical protein
MVNFINLKTSFMLDYEAYQSLIGPGIFGILPEAINMAFGSIRDISTIHRPKPKGSKPIPKNLSLRSRYHQGAVLRRPGQPL